jgi:phosphopantetheine--protein transferase-like protein
VIGFALGKEIGVDVERRRARAELALLAHTAFSPDEYARFCAIPQHEGEAAFFLCWSRKEAFVKATGEGVSQLMDFDVSLEPAEPQAEIDQLEQRLPAGERASIESERILAADHGTSSDACVCRSLET